MSTIANSESRLVDRFDREHRYLRISVTDRCNLRCLYCMPPEGIQWKPKQELLTYEEIKRLADLFCQLGVDKIRITGGEPTIREDIEILLESLSQLQGLKTLGITTNGLTLSKKAHRYHSVGVNALNISLDSLRKDRYFSITRRDALREVLKGIEESLEVGYDSIKLNVVIMSGINDDEILDFVQFVSNRPMNVRFIEFMPFKNNHWNLSQVISSSQIKHRIQQHYELLPLLSEKSSVAKDFMMPGFLGTVSFISSMTDSFCSTCNRIRLTADGSIKSCLFSPAEVSLRDAMRNDASDVELVGLMYKALMLKPEAHEPASAINSDENRSMVQIGG